MILALVALFHERRIQMENAMGAIAADPRTRAICLGHRA